MRVIFLDFDGVLNSKNFFSSKRFRSEKEIDFGDSMLDPESVSLVNQIIDATGAKVVISSSWRHIWNVSEITKMLQNKGFKHVDAVIGQTPEFAQNGGNRGAEIQEWLDLDNERSVIGQERVTSFVIIDDIDEFDSTQHQNFIKTNVVTGITPDDVKRAISILSRG